MMCCTKCGDVKLMGTIDPTTCYGGKYRHKMNETTYHWSCVKCNNHWGKGQFTFKDGFIKRDPIDGRPVDMKFGCSLSKNDWLAKNIIE